MRGVVLTEKVRVILSNKLPRPNVLIETSHHTTPYARNDMHAHRMRRLPQMRVYLSTHVCRRYNDGKYGTQELDEEIAAEMDLN